MPLVAAALLSLLFTGLAFAQSTVTVQQGLNGGISADDWITCCGTANTNEGALTEIDLRDPSGDSSLVRFNIFQSEGGPVPNGATITSATLSLYKFAGPDAVVQANRLLKNWDEMQASWNNATTGVPWTTPGALASGSDYLATADGQGSIGDAVVNGCMTSSGPFPTACWLNINVTAGVQAFSSGTAQNFGWKISQVSSTDPFGMKDFNSKDFATVAGRPMLTITYSTPSGCASGTLRPYDQAPVSGNAISIPSGGATFEAEYFNCGGQNVAYHDNVAGNAGNAGLRTSEDVDIVTSSGAANGTDVNNFETGEWLTYTINVAADGNYDIAVLASNHMGSTVTHHIDIGPADGSSYANKGTISIPDTGGFDTFNWFTLSAVRLTAGQQVLRLFADSQWANVDQIRITSNSGQQLSGCPSGTLRPYDGTPISGNPISIPSGGATFEAEYFNCGGQNIAYHDNVTGNAGNAGLRTSEDVDISTSPGAANGTNVNNFETGEWLTYTINVAAAGNYDIAVLASNHMGSTVTHHIDIGPADGSSYANKGTIPIADTGGFDTFNWFTLRAVPLTAGQQVLRLFAESQWANVDQIRLTPVPPPENNPASLLFRTGWESGVSLATPGAPDPVRYCWSDGCWQAVIGTDASTGFTWPPNVYGSASNASSPGGTAFQLLVAVPNPAGGDWNAGALQGYMHQTIVAGGHSGSNSVYQEISQSGCCGTNPQGDGATQEPLQILPPQDVSDLYISYWIKLQSDMAAKVLAGDPWRGLFEIKTVDQPSGGPDWRYQVQINAFGQFGGALHWRVLADHYYPYEVFWDTPVDPNSVPIPVGQWFKFEVYWHRSSGSDGRVWSAINGVVLDDHRGPNIGAASAPINRIFITSLYTGGTYPIYQWVDDLQIWTSFPNATSSDAWYDPPYAPH